MVSKERAQSRSGRVPTHFFFSTIYMWRNTGRRQGSHDGRQVHSLNQCKVFWVAPHSYLSHPCKTGVRGCRSYAATSIKAVKWKEAGHRNRSLCPGLDRATLSNSNGTSRGLRRQYWGPRPTSIGEVTGDRSSESMVAHARLTLVTPDVLAR
jgi:hypothetical protein